MSKLTRRLLRLAPPYYEARLRLYAALYGGMLKDTGPLDESTCDKIEKIAGWYSWFNGADWVELKMEAEAIGAEIKTVRDLVRLLEAIDNRYE